MQKRYKKEVLFVVIRRFEKKCVPAGSLLSVWEITGISYTKLRELFYEKKLNFYAETELEIWRVNYD